MVVGYGYNGTSNTSYDAFLWTTGVVPFYDLSATSQAGVNDLNTLAASVLPSGWVLNVAARH